ncbi:hypothetical protein AFERRI_100090 [Acidithiobacillus ferrivorans]|uniref:Uncharacterized protein n=1 Tax=Acidithiobacillus ferrivorans TaxID=160808 RepID=A0A060UJG3_9PROT|nr:hypothetical protein AFERRI_100090 [Acidithiobacillus ferrivorans]
MVPVSALGGAVFRQQKGISTSHANIYRHAFNGYYFSPQKNRGEHIKKRSYSVTFRRQDLTVLQYQHDLARFAPVVRQRRQDLHGLQGTPESTLQHLLR